MNTKVILGILAAIIIVVAGYFALRPKASVAPVVVPAVATSTQTSAVQPTPQVPAKDSSKPTFAFGSTTVSTVAVDKESLTSTSSNPIITGTSNAKKVGVVVSDSKGVGIVGAFELPVVNGHWSYAVSVALVPGDYSVTVLGDAVSAIAQLKIVPL